MISKHNLIQLKDYLISEIILITCFLSATIYWIYGIEFRINILSLCKLLVLYLIVMPPALLISQKGVGILKKIFGGRLPILKICLYIVFSSIAYYTIALQKHVLPLDNISTPRLIQFILVVAIYSFALTWKPLLFLAAFRFLQFFNKEYKNTLDLNWQIAIIFIVYFLLKGVGYLSLYEGIGEPAIRATLGKMMNSVLDIAEINFFHTPALIKYIKNIYFVTWIYLLTISLLLPQVVHLQNIGIGKIKATTTEMFKQTPLIWIFFIIITLKTLFFNRLILHMPVIIMSSFYFVFLKALFEEICFRGVLQSCFFNILRKLKLRINITSFIAILLSSILFTLHHYPFLRWHNISFIFLFGLLSGRMYYKTTSIMPALIAHTAINLLIQTA